MPDGIPFCMLLDLRTVFAHVFTVLLFISFPNCYYFILFFLLWYLKSKRLS